MQSTLAIVGRGRLGPALAAALDAAGRRVLGPLGRGADGAGADVVLLCVPDAEIGAAAARPDAPRRPLVGHCSGATGLGVLRPHEALGLHPLMTVTHAGAAFAGAGCAIGGSTLRALHVAESLAAALGMRAVRGRRRRPRRLPRRRLDRLELPRRRSRPPPSALAATAGVRRAAARAARPRHGRELGGARAPRRALTGPIARGDEAVVARQRDGRRRAHARAARRCSTRSPTPRATLARAGTDEVPA